MRYQKPLLAVSLAALLSILGSCEKDEAIAAADPTPVSKSVNSSDKFNILVIIADDMGIDTLSVYGKSNDVARTPHLDALARQGLVFENAWATPACSTTRAALLTGKHGIHNGVPSVPGTLGQDQVTIQKFLKTREKSQDYRSAVFGKWHLAGRDGDPRHPNTLGIDHYSGNLRGNISNYSDWLETTNGESRDRTDYHTRAITQSTIDWIGQQNAPWFAWLAYSAPHAPFHLPPSDLQASGLSGKDLEANKRAYYLSMIEAMDSEIGRLIAAIPDDQKENTVIMFMGDNGTPRPVIDRNVYPGRQGKSTLFEGGIQVPFIISGGAVKMSGKTDSLVNVVDVFPTVAELAGHELPTHGHAYSLMPILSGQPSSRDLNYSEYESQRVTGWTVRDARYKLIHLENGSEQLFDLQSDPREQNDLIRDPSLATQADRLRAYGQELRNESSATETIDPNREPGLCHNHIGSSQHKGTDIARNLSFDGSVVVRHSHTHCTIASNAIPNHDFNDGRRAFPNQPQAVSGSYRIPDKPEKAPTPTPLSLRWDNAVMLNGVKVDVLAAGCYGVGDGRISCNNDQQPWRYDPLFKSSGFNMDSHNAHTQPNGAYHYHGLPPALAGDGQSESGVIGFAADGFPIYGLYMQQGSDLRKVRSSYRLKSGSRPSGNGNPGGNYDGTYRDDYEYVPGLGDLDACNGREVNGEYRYHVTEGFPYVLGCLSGTPDPSFQKTRNAGSRNDRTGRRDGRQGEIRRGERRQNRLSEEERRERRLHRREQGR